MTLAFVGIGIAGPEQLTQAAIKAIRDADVLFIDTYTGFTSEEMTDYVTSMAKKPLPASRQILEDNQRKLVEEAMNENVALLVPGDPFIATTHVSLLLEAKRRGVAISIVNGISVVSAAASRTGLQAYKFGRIVTVPREADPEALRTTYQWITENNSRGLHTLVLLDTAGGFMTVPEALSTFLNIEKMEGKGVAAEGRLVVALSGLAEREEIVKVGRLIELCDVRFKSRSQSLIFPGKLHFMEIEALRELHLADEMLLRQHQISDPEKSRIQGYIQKVERVLPIAAGNANSTMEKGLREKLFEHVSNYVKDSKYFLDQGDKSTALSSISYCEGILDSLRILGLAGFSWEGAV